MPRICFRISELITVGSPKGKAQALWIGIGFSFNVTYTGSWVLVYWVLNKGHWGYLGPGLAVHNTSGVPKAIQPRQSRCNYKPRARRTHGSMGPLLAHGAMRLLHVHVRCRGKSFTCLLLARPSSGAYIPVLLSSSAISVYSDVWPARATCARL